MVPPLPLVRRLRRVNPLFSKVDLEGVGVKSADGGEGEGLLLLLIDEGDGTIWAMLHRMPARALLLGLANFSDLTAAHLPLITKNMI